MTSMTKRFRVAAAAPETSADEIAEAARLLREGGTVAFPTETVYGLGANACDEKAVERIFAAKGRPSDNPLIVHISDLEQLEPLVLPYDDTAQKLMDRFWPGPLTIVLPVRPGAVSPRVTAGLDTVAVRMPAHPVALALIDAAGVPVAGPSANSSGRPSPTEAGHVLDDLDGKIDAIVDGGSAGVGLESTVVEVVADGVVRILRPGGLTAEALLEAVGGVEFDAAAAPETARRPPGPGPAAADGVRHSAAWNAGDAPAADDREGARSPGPGPAAVARPAAAAASPLAAQPLAGEGAAPRSPGMKYAHYAPRGVMELVRGGPEALAAYIGAREREARAQGERTGVLAFAEHAGLFQADRVLVVGSLARLETAAQGLYAALRAFDRAGVTRIWAEACPQEGIGHALMNRLAKAASHRIVDLT